MNFGSPGCNLSAELTPEKKSAREIIFFCDKIHRVLDYVQSNQSPYSSDTESQCRIAQVLAGKILNCLIKTSEQSNGAKLIARFKAIAVKNTKDFTDLGFRLYKPDENTPDAESVFTFLAIPSASPVSRVVFPVKDLLSVVADVARNMPIKTSHHDPGIPFSAFKNDGEKARFLESIEVAGEFLIALEKKYRRYARPYVSSTSLAPQLI